MNEAELDIIIKKCAEEGQLHAYDIPSLDLYLDQILTLFSAHLGEKGQAGLTKTMINNYSKDGLIKPVKGKKYSKEHILQMMLIYYLKGVLSIGDIKRLFDGIYSDGTFGENELTDCYERFLKVRTENGKICRDISKKIAEKHGLDIENDYDLFVLGLSLASVSEMLKNIVLEMINAKYPTPLPQKNAEAEKEKKAKKKSADKTDKEKAEKEAKTKAEENTGNEEEK